MRSSLWLGAAVLLVVAAAGPVRSATFYFKAHLSGAGEAPLVATTGQGDVTAQVDTGTKVLRYKITYRGLSGPATAAQFNGPATAPKAAPAVVTVSDASSPISGEAILTNAQIAELRSGLWYFNVPTAANPGGEIRGQLTPDRTQHVKEQPPEEPSPFPIEQPMARPASLSAR